MHPNPHRIAPVVLILALIAFFNWCLVNKASASSIALSASGTITATQVHISPELGGRVIAIHVKEGDPVKAGNVLDTQIKKLTLTSPIDGVVLTRAIEVGELATPGANLLVIGQVNDLTVTVYVSEDRYGQIALGQSYPVTVDSYPGENFAAKVTHIADQAEFTPRNVQTAQNRKTTVFAVRLSRDSNGGKLKPGMPADVTLSK